MGVVDTSIEAKFGVSDLFPSTRKAWVRLHSNLDAFARQAFRVKLVNTLSDKS